MGFAAVFFLVAAGVAFLVVVRLAAGFSVFLSAFSVLTLFLVVAAFLGAAALGAAALGAVALGAAFYSQVSNLIII